MWKQIDQLLALPACTCDASKQFNDFNHLIKLIQFLMGLDSICQSVRTNLLTRETLPSMKDAFSIISREESHLHTKFFSEKVPNSTVGFAVKTNQVFDSKKKGIRPPNPSLKCSHCNKTGHTVEKCFELVGYPLWMKSKNNGNKGGMDSQTKKVQVIGNQFDGLYLCGSSSVKVCSASCDVNLWHARLGHPAEVVLHVLKNKLDVKNVSLSPCETCNRAKQHRDPFPLSDHKSKMLGELVHLDVWGPYKVPSRDGLRFFLTIVDDYTRAIWVYLMRHKREVFHNTQGFFNWLKTQFGKHVKVFRSDNGTDTPHPKVGPTPDDDIKNDPISDHGSQQSNVESSDTLGKVVSQQPSVTDEHMDRANHDTEVETIFNNSEGDDVG
ncbi:uncharacterized protein LOC110913532 [Helianthus annuus]|uniref:uncharacterized protein LOC110913532 n=1 Tax=Helianthus annuus TaxID=4232 RepID=UPI0016530A34|nr:uncharacterized protein LOC110913532 [Helianthus annuus]